MSNARVVLRAIVGMAMLVSGIIVIEAEPEGFAEYVSGGVGAALIGFGLQAMGALHCPGCSHTTRLARWLDRSEASRSGDRPIHPGARLVGTVQCVFCTFLASSSLEGAQAMRAHYEVYHRVEYDRWTSLETTP